MRRSPATTGAFSRGCSTPTCTGRDRTASRSAAGARCWRCWPTSGSLPARRRRLSYEMDRSTDGWLGAARPRAVGLVRRSGRHCGAGRADGRSRCGDHVPARHVPHQSRRGRGRLDCWSSDWPAADPVSGGASWASWRARGSLAGSPPTAPWPSTASSSSGMVRSPRRPATGSARSWLGRGPVGSARYWVEPEVPENDHAASLATVSLLEQRRWLASLPSSGGMLLGSLTGAALGLVIGLA